MNIQHPDTPGQSTQAPHSLSATTQFTELPTAPLIETYFDQVTHDFCAECADFDGLISWGVTAQEARDKVQCDWLRHQRQAEQEQKIVNFLRATSLLVTSLCETRSKI